MRLRLKCGGLFRNVSASNRTDLDERRMKKKPAALSPIYKNPAAPVARRVKDLLARMTLEEKAAQMMCVWQEQGQKLVDRWGKFEQSYL